MFRVLTLIRVLPVATSALDRAEPPVPPSFSSDGLESRHYAHPLKYFSAEENLGQSSVKAESRSASLFSLLRTASTIAAKSGSPEGLALERIAYSTHLIKEPLACIEVSAHALIAVSAGREFNGAMVERLKPLIRSIAEKVKTDRWKPEQRILRLANLTTDETPRLLHQWIELRDRVPREAGASTIVDLLKVVLAGSKALSELERLDKEFSSPGKIPAWNRVDEIWRREKPKILKALGSGEMFKAFSALVPYEHSDWLRPLGNALTRALKLEGEGPALVSNLDANNFWKTKTRARQGREHDGIGVVQSAADEGRLLELSSSLETWKKKAPKTKTTPGSEKYPQDVFEVAAALNKWHKVIVQRLARQS